MFGPSDFRVILVAFWIWFLCCFCSCNWGRFHDLNFCRNFAQTLVVVACSHKTWLQWVFDHTVAKSSWTLFCQRQCFCFDSFCDTPCTTWGRCGLKAVGCGGGRGRTGRRPKASKEGEHPKSEIAKLMMLQLDDFPIIRLLIHAA